MPGCGSRVVNGYGAISGVARVSLRQKLAFAGVGTAEDDRPAGPLPLNVRAVMALSSRSFWPAPSPASPC